ncbi:hypothetical protein ASPTUDRAFT_75544 [Aspergillus tubingensis CBS 134.48]|uniref:Uncharacterized protein n=1 Tax=Aspergillus tubingensis (strain CBS 134.48) TaxID=767770 RepID=A0A1L9N408_ASPTC|nr:hypothetical protein ASPTUDRAFT_75544 [Aspergillus tubingensis CBS 134.48]
MDPKPEHLVVRDGVSGRHGREASRKGNIERHRGERIRVEGQQTRAGEADKSGRRNRGQRRQAHRGTANMRMVEIAGDGNKKLPGLGAECIFPGPQTNQRVPVLSDARLNGEG